MANSQQRKSGTQARARAEKAQAELVGDDAAVDETEAAVPAEPEPAEVSPDPEPEASADLPDPEPAVQPDLDPEPEPVSEGAAEGTQNDPNAFPKDVLVVRADSLLGVSSALARGVLAKGPDNLTVEDAKARIKAYLNSIVTNPEA